MHVGHVKYGDQPQSLTVDKWWYRGDNLYEAYDTTQVFLDEYPHGIYSVLPPYYQFRMGFVKWNWSKYMQLTRIYLRQYSRTILLAAGVMLGASIAHAFAPEKEAAQPTEIEAEVGAEQVVLAGSGATVGQYDLVPLIYRLRITSYASDNFGTRVKFGDGGDEYSEAALQAIGFQVARTGRCRYRLTRAEHTVIVTC